ncbi:MAG: 2-C-methyl-D-erythritol 4-phosphate cytidylyltransferase [Candidatus Firestonebacteria bacterium RIFOXYA2_FULL_40_8]|nr:MAG: 2-C-methyl-D-erythritol 4-phosphate cytidylyltransferase [Candidatus Firestonebacteria bacterium RIFOXYA2_FULL_40_8]
MIVSVIIVAAGSSKRLGGKLNKPYLHINGKPALYYSLKTFLAVKSVKEVLVVIREKDENIFRKLLKKYKFFSVKYTFGGAERKDSVLNGLNALENKKGIVLIHDAARPFVSIELIGRVIKAALRYKAAIPVIPVKDTVKYSTCGSFSDKTLDRSKLFLAQTPQGFDFELLMKANLKASAKNIMFTDDAMLMELIGKKTALVSGGEDNIKITTKADLQ